MITITLECLQVKMFVIRQWSSCAAWLTFLQILCLSQMLEPDVVEGQAE